MASEVDQLKDAIGAETDTALADALGLQRSTVAQWRRRGSLSAQYRQLLEELDEASHIGARLAVRRQLYGDSSGRFLLSSALGVIPTEALDLPQSLSNGNVGWARESLILNVIEAIQTIAQEVLGKSKCENHDEFIRLNRALRLPRNQKVIERALSLPIHGEL